MYMHLIPVLVKLPWRKWISVPEDWQILWQQGLYDTDPLRIERLSANWLAGPSVPIRSIVSIAFLAVQVGVNPGALPPRVFLSGFMRALPVAPGIPP